MYLNGKMYCLILVCTVICVLFAPVFAASDLLPGRDIGSVSPVSGQQVIQPSDVTPLPETPVIVTVEPTPIPTSEPITIEPTTVPTTQPTTVETTVLTMEPTPIPTTISIPLVPIISPEDQAQAGNDSNISNIAPAITGTCQNATIELNQSSSNPPSGGFNLSWTASLTDPPLNNTNLQGTAGGQYLGDQCDHRFQWLLSPRPCRTHHQFPVRDLDP